jgi:hypothetical protein
MTYNLHVDVAAWLAADHYGTQANRLRCAAMCAMEENVTAAEFVDACRLQGVNHKTARNRWCEVARSL